MSTNGKKRWTPRNEQEQVYSPEVRARIALAAHELVELTRGDTRALAIELRNRVATPMHVVLGAVKGHSMAEKAKRIGVSRQTLYTWWRDEARPTHRMAKRLAQLTRIPAHEIMGRRP